VPDSVKYKSIRSKFSLVIVSACFAVILLISLLFGGIEYFSFRQNSAEELQTLAAVLGGHLAQPLLENRPLNGKEILTGLKPNRSIHAAYLFDHNNKPFAQYLDPKYGNFVQAALLLDFDGQVPPDWLESEVPVFRFGLNSLSLYFPLIYQDSKIGALYLLSDLADLDQRLLSLVLVVVIAGGVAIAFAWRLSAILQKPISTPILDLVETVHMVSATGDYRLRSHKYSADEIGQLVDGFNDMLNQIELRDLKISTHQKYLEKTVSERTAALIRTVHDLELAKEQADSANQAKSTFLANMTHELRTPLVGVLGMNELLIESSLNPSQRSLAESVERSGRELLQIINDILDFSKIEGGHLVLEKQNVELLVMVEEIMAMLSGRAHAKGINLVCSVDPDAAWTVNADVQRLKQILVNLVGNAIKFTAQGSVSLQLSRLKNGRFVFVVADTGIGIEPEAQAEIFEAFTQVDVSTSRLFGGTGLGLSIVRDLTRMMDGEISLQSAPGQGATFRVELPLYAVAPSFVCLPANDRKPSVLLLDPIVTSNMGFAADAVATQEDLVEKLESLGRADLCLYIEEVGPVSETLETQLRQRCDRTYCLRKNLLQEHLPTWCIDLQRPLLWRRLLQLDPFAEQVEVLINDVHSEAIPLVLPIEAASSAKGRLLIVDDNVSTRELVGFSLAGSGWCSDGAVGAVDALAKLELRTYQLILMDINMPGMDGLELTRLLRQKGLETPIYALTAHGDARILAECLTVGMQGILRKPFRQQELFEVLDQYMMSRDPAPASSEGGPLSTGRYS